MTEPPGALQRCVGDPARFSARVWGRRPSLHRGTDDATFDDLLSLADVDSLIASAGLRAPAFRLVRDGASLDPKTYTKTARTGGALIDGVADPVKVHRRFSEGATIVLQGMHRYWPPLARFCRDLEWALGHPAQVNAYVTPPGARGLAVHEDAHDVFVLQAFGTKRWRVWETGAGVGRARDGDVEPAIAAVVRPGDTIYLPRETPHAAEAQDAASGHLTIGVPATTWFDVLRRSLEGLREEMDLREPLPVGYHLDPEGFASAAEERLKSLRAWVERLDADGVAAGARRRFLTTRPPLVGGGLADALAVDGLTDDSVLRRRPGSICVLEPDGDVLRVLLGDRELRVPARLGPVMELVSARAEVSPRDLAGHLDEAGRLVLVRRLVREGLLEVAR